MIDNKKRMSSFQFKHIEKTEVNSNENDDNNELTLFNE